LDFKWDLYLYFTFLLPFLYFLLMPNENKSKFVKLLITTNTCMNNIGVESDEQCLNVYICTISWIFFI